MLMEAGKGGRDGKADGGLGAGPSLRATARDSTGREDGGGHRGRPGAAASSLHQQQLRVIRWERFLPRRSLRVLLVEQDDSTRHIVTALLRKCSYHVASVADGLKAWNVLKEKNYSFDLVLSEVEVPSLSGISLLCKIMTSELSKNIPVIMMSSHDSVSVVVRCMQKGAVDFLVKPVRKNELRNLWQHVWRRHCSTNFTYGPETMPNNDTVSENMSDNNAASNDVSANAGKGSRNGESDGGDDQSSGSKPLIQNEGPEQRGLALTVDDRNSTKVIMSQPQKIDDNIGVVADALNNHVDDKIKDKSGGLRVTLSVQETAMSDKVQEQIQLDEKSLSIEKGLGYARGEECTDAAHRPFLQKVVMYKSPEGITDFIGSVVKEQCSFSAIDNHRERGSAFCETRRSSNVINTSTADSSPSWELSLRRPQLNGCVKNGFLEKNVLNHSAASAFSRYAHSGICLPGQKSGSSLANVYIRARESADVCQPQLDRQGTLIERPIPFIPNGSLDFFQRNEEIVVSSSNDEDAEPLASAPSGEDTLIGYSDSKNHIASPHSHLGMMPLPMPVGAIPFQGFYSGYGPILQPVFYHEASASPLGSAAIKQAKCLTSSDQPADNCNHVNANFQSITFQSHEEDHHPYFSELRKKDGTVDIAQGNPRGLGLHTCGSEEHTDQSVSYSGNIINGDGSNGNGGTGDAAVTTKTAFEHRNESRLHNYGGKGVDPHCSHREAALIKFRLKRKDRCFEKKVRYHSRKMLAEQRPRIKGQFVRQATVDSEMTATEVDY